MKESLESLLRTSARQRTVLGIDVYRYSKYPRLPQAIIPHVLRSILLLTVEDLIKHEEALFSGSAAPNLDRDYIDTGDGGFIVFEQPLRALLFLLYFQANMRVYNCANVWPELTYITGALSARYCLTLQYLYRYESNWYGPAIINNARILSADKLNRLLVDANVKEWFDLNTNGIETLAVLGLEDLKRNKKLKQVLAGSASEKSVVFPKKAAPMNMIRNINLSQIGQIDVKDDVIAIHNLHIQYYLNYLRAPDISKNIVTIGNLNTQGIGTI